jgi:hypothetical protein
VHDSQHKPTRHAPTVYGFDDEGERVPVVAPPEDCGDDEAVASEAERIVQDRKPLAFILRELVALLVTAKTPLQLWQFVQVLAFFFDMSDCRTLTQLASKLNVSKGRVSQIISALPCELRFLRHLKRRPAAKPRP